MCQEKQPLQKVLGPEGPIQQSKGSSGQEEPEARVRRGHSLTQMAFEAPQEYRLQLKDHEWALKGSKAGGQYLTRVTQAQWRE